MSNHTTRRRLGSVRQKPNGRWLARIQHGEKIDGSPRVMSKTWDTKAEAESWLMAQSVKLNERPDLSRGLTLRKLWEVYERIRLPELAKTTQAVYRQRMAKVLEAMGDADVSTIRHGDVQLMLDDMRPSIARKTANVLSSVLTFGVRNNLLAENVMHKAPFIYGEQSRFAEADSDVWNTDPFAAIEQRRDVWNMRITLVCMERIRGLALEPVWLACVGAGLRVEEAFALRKMDVRRIVGSFDEYGKEIWVTQLAIHHATTRDETRKSTKTTRSVGVVPMLEPFGKRYWELTCACAKNDEVVCKLSAARQNKTWRAYFDEPPTRWSKHMAESRKVTGKLYGLPYIPLSRMRATHTTLVQEAGVLDSMNRSWHRNTSAVQQRHYMAPDLTQTAIEVSRKFC